MSINPVTTWHADTYPSISPLRPELSAAGKSVLITGGASGIGKHIATSFVQAGASYLGLIGRSTASLASAKQTLETTYPGVKVSTFSVDLTDAAALTDAVTTFAGSVPGGKLDILVANAGHLAKVVNLEDSKLDDWWADFEVNVRGNYTLVRAALPVLGPAPVIINVTSAIASFPYQFGYSSYAGSKLASAKMFEYLRYERPEIRVTSYHPGVIRGTEMDKKVIESGRPFPYEEPELAGDFAVWLASPEAKFLNGRYVWCQWDVDELKAMAAEIEGSLLFTVGVKGFPPQTK